MKKTLKELKKDFKELKAKYEDVEKLCIEYNANGFRMAFIATLGTKNLTTYVHLIGLKRMVPVEIEWNDRYLKAVKVMEKVDGKYKAQRDILSELRENFLRYRDFKAFRKRNNSIFWRDKNKIQTEMMF